MEYAGMDIMTNDRVYEPAEDSFLAADVVGEELEKMDAELKVLDLGCGTGILGLVAAARPNVDRVIMADINDDALDLCRENIRRNRDMLHAQCDVVKSDLFSGMTGTFDMIIFNAPYLPDEGDRNELPSAWYGGKRGIETSKRFVHETLDHITEKSVIVLVVSSLGDLKALNDEIIACGYSIDREKKVHVHFEDIIAMVLSRRHYFGS